MSKRERERCPKPGSRSCDSASEHSLNSHIGVQFHAEHLLADISQHLHCRCLGSDNSVVEKGILAL